MRDEIALSDYLDPGDENLNPEELGRRIDDCLVHHIEVYTGCLIDGAYSIEEFNLVMDKIQEGMKEDSDYQAFAASLQETESPTRQRDLPRVGQAIHALYGGKRRLLLGARSRICSCSHGTRKERSHLEGRLGQRESYRMSGRSVSGRSRPCRTPETHR